MYTAYILLVESFVLTMEIIYCFRYLLCTLRLHGRLREGSSELSAEGQIPRHYQQYLQEHVANRKGRDIFPGKFF